MYGRLQQLKDNATIKPIAAEPKVKTMTLKHTSKSAKKFAYGSKVATPTKSTQELGVPAIAESKESTLVVPAIAESKESTLVATAVPESKASTLGVSAVAELNKTSEIIL
jgi:hypothetical protein